MLPHHISVCMEYDDIKKGTIEVLAPNMWTDYFVNRHVNMSYGYAHEYSGNWASLWDPPTHWDLSSYDVAHAHDTTTFYGGVGGITYKEGSFSYITTENLTFTSEMSTTQMREAEHPCTMVMYPTSDNIVRNFWVQDMAFSWGGETFYVEQPMVGYQYTSASVSASASALSMYSVSGMRIGMPVRLTKSVSEVVRVANIIDSTSIGVSGLTITGGTNTNTYQQGTAVLADGALIYTNKSTASASINVSDTAIHVVNATNFAANQPITLYDGTNWESHVIGNISSNTINITGGMQHAYANGVAILGGFKSSHTAATTIIPKDHYAMSMSAVTFGTNEGTAYGVGQPIKTIGIRTYYGATDSSNPAVIILLPFGILKDNSTYSGTLTLKYYYWTVGRYHV